MNAPERTATPELTAAGEERPAPLAAAELRQEIDRTRQDLGATVAALVAKTDVKAQLSRRFERWRTRSSGGPSVVLGAIAGAVAVAVALVLLRRAQQKSVPPR